MELCSSVCGMSPSPSKASKAFGTEKKRRQSDLCGEMQGDAGGESCSLNCRTNRNVVLGLQDIYSLTHFDCKGYKHHFCYSSKGQYLGNTGQSTKEFSPHSNFPLKKKKTHILSLNNEFSHLNHEFGFIRRWETEAEQNTSANTPTGAPQLASPAEERSQIEVVEMLGVRTEVSWQN